MGITGLTSQFSGINEALPIAQYFLICRELGEAPKWPGNLASYHRVENMSYAPSIAGMTVLAASQGDCKNQAFKHCNGDVVVWRFLWNHFGQSFKVPLGALETLTEDTPSMNLAE
ncbi:hypothetical protein BBP40_006949 [Aspergillus hancockii]|nr:hypothetical protein BBP40_006949 [Aspergillus hancockii]